MMSTALASRSLFHYTTGDGLIGIVRDSRLYATHFDFMNDPSECKVIKDLLAPPFQKELKELTEKLIKAGILKKEILNEFGRRYYSIETETLFGVLYKATYAVAPFFLRHFVNTYQGRMNTSMAYLVNGAGMHEVASQSNLMSLHSTRV